MGYYSVAFTNNTFYTDKFTYYFNYIFVLAFIIAGIVFVICKYNSNQFIRKHIRILFTIILVFFIIVLVRKYAGTEYFLAFKQGVALILEKPWGNFGLDLSFNNSTSNMWLEYGRDYGVLVFGTLFIFLSLTVSDLIRLVLNKNISIFTKTLFVVVFCGINIYYFIDAFSYTNPQYWYIGLIICGIINELANKSLQTSCEFDITNAWYKKYPYGGMKYTYAVGLCSSFFYSNFALRNRK